MAALAEDLLLLLLDDDSGRAVVDGTSVDNALAGAVLLDLVQSGRVSPVDPPDDRKRQKLALAVRDRSPTADPVLDQALARLDGKDPVKAQRAVELLAKGLRPAVLERLADDGSIRREQRKVLGIFPRTSWPAVTAEREELVRAQLSAALVDGETPDAHTAGLVALLHAINAVPKVVAGERKALKARAAEISADAWAGTAVKEAVKAIQMAMITSVAATAAAAAAASG